MKSILIVDDAAENIRLLKAILQSDGYSVKVANSGKRCLEVLEKSPRPDLILLDIMMPEMDGYEVISRIKANETTRNIPVIFITTKDAIGDEKKGLDLGAVDFITKPVDHIITLARVKTHLDLYGYRRQLESMVEEKTQEVIAQKDRLFRQSKHAAMGEMIDAIAHQWQQPISIIKMKMELLGLDYADGALDGEYVRNHRESVTKQLDHMVTTLKEFRNFLRPNKALTRFGAKQMVDKVALLMKDELIKHQIEIVVTEQQPVELHAVENEVMHLLINLINNAKDAFVENGIKHRVIAVEIDRQDDRHRIAVTDNAGGIPDAVIGDIFKANITTKAEGKGTGIGLYMSMQIAEKYNGTLDVANVDNGARFTFTLPAERP
jgi:CheY-like chemotaxis protein/K+-sensing histidine kinase KdpD